MSSNSIGSDKIF